MESAESNIHASDKSENFEGTSQQDQDEKEELGGSVHLGKYKVIKPSSMKIKSKLEGHHIVHTAKIKIASGTMNENRWDYKSDIKINVKGESLMGGLCLKGKILPDHSLELDIYDYSKILNEKIIPYLSFFGMTNQEQLFWFPQFLGFPEPVIPKFNNDTKLRPFMYAVPLKNFTTLGEKQTINVNDLGITSGESDNVFYPIVEKLNLQDKDAWKKENPKVFGVVMAHTFIEAEQLAFERARLTVDLINFSIRTGMSHWENRREYKVLEWDRDIARVQVNLWNWVLLREVQTVKGWIRTPLINDINKAVDLDNVFNRIAFFLNKFITVSSVGDLASQAGKQTLSKTEKRIISRRLIL